MIIEAILNALYNVFNTLTSFINIPDMPTKGTEMITELFGYLKSGAGILANYTDLGYLLTLFGVIVAVDLGIKIYHFVIWILKKIPMLGIE